MSRDSLIAVYDREEAILAATRAAREKGYTIFDAFTPYPVHGMDEAMGLARTRLTVVCFVLGLAGMVTALSLQLWASGADWPINIGGKSDTAFPALVPIAFEVTVLFAAIGTVLAFFARSRLWPGKVPALVKERVTDDRFVLVLEWTGGEVEEAKRLLARYGAIEIAQGERAR